MSGAILSREEYDAASRADHGTVRRYLSGCRCDLCDTPANHRFQDRSERETHPTEKGDAVLIARELHRQGLGYTLIARELGISRTTARRYVQPGTWERHREQSRRNKQKRRGACRNCGAETRYNGKTVNGPSELCLPCASRLTGGRKRRTGERQLQLAGLLATRGPQRLTGIASLLGITANHAMVLLIREMRAGRVVRVKRGTYDLAP